MRFIYLLFLCLNFFGIKVNSNNNQFFNGINECEINQKDFNGIKLKNLNNGNSKISISSIVKIRNNRINSAITEAKLKAKKKLIKFLVNENLDNQTISRLPNNSFNHYLRGAMVTQICIQNNTFLKLTLVINDKSINISDKKK